MSGRTNRWQTLLVGGTLLASAGLLMAQAPQPVGGEAPAPSVAAPAAADQPAPTVNGVRPVATVNGEAITQADLDLALKQAGPLPVQLPEARKKQMQFEMLGMLLDEALMRQFLAKNAPPVNAAEIDQKLAELAEGLKKQGKSVADLCRETHQSEAQFRANLAYRIQWENFTQARVTEAEVQRYYHEYRDFFDGNTVKASHIVLRIAPDAPAADVDAARAKLAGMRDDILAKKVEFAAAAKQFSQCQSAANGGDIGFIPRKWVVEESFARAAFRLQPGQISDVIRTDYGLHIVQVTERKAGTPSDYDRIRGDVREFYKEDLRQQILTQQRKDAKIQIQLQ